MKIQRTGKAVIIFLLAISNLCGKLSVAQTFAFKVSMKNPGSHYFNVEMTVTDLNPGIIDFKIPVWTPGYYQYLNFHENVENLSIVDNDGNVLEYAKSQPNAWRIKTKTKGTYNIKYDVKTIRPFVATPWIDTSRAYVSPPGVFLHIAGMLNKPVEVTIDPYPGWNRVSTGLDSVAGKSFTYRAENFDVLYDSPILIGALEALTPFEVAGKPHYFIGYKLGDFDKPAFMADLKKIVQSASDLIGDVPYHHYTFIPIGPGGGGIEHLNSTSISFSGSALNNPKSKLGVYNFISHEYFHHYNVKRIRPIELGPFDYDKGSKTNMLWVSEGLSVYYEYLVVHRAGLSTEQELIDALHGNILDYENKPGRHYQSLAQSSYETWSDGPMGRVGDDVNKTISYYQKGPVVGWLFDLAIRNATKNTKSLDDVMRLLYNKYYKQLKRGFKETEFRAELEKIAGAKFDELFEYIYTTKELNYNKYLNYAGLQADTTHKALEGGWLGANARMRNDSLYVVGLDYGSPALAAGVRQGTVILSIDGQPVKTLNAVIKEKKVGDKVRLKVLIKGEEKELEIALGEKVIQGFEISKMASPNTLQQQIFESWSGEKQ